ncbi:MAG TPA: hypothetical protein VGB90_09615 [Alphaproteobacteria bacterium]|jgi:hypothetical protein
MTAPAFDRLAVLSLAACLRATPLPRERVEQLGELIERVAPDLETGTARERLLLLAAREVVVARGEVPALIMLGAVLDHFKAEDLRAEAGNDNRGHWWRRADL